MRCLLKQRERAFEKALERRRFPLCLSLTPDVEKKKSKRQQHVLLLLLLTEAEEKKKKRRKVERKKTDLSEQRKRMKNEKEKKEEESKKRKSLFFARGSRTSPSCLSLVGCVYTHIHLSLYRRINIYGMYRQSGKHIDLSETGKAP